MSRTIRFLGRYSMQWLSIFAGFAVFIMAGCWLSGTVDGLFGTYAEVFFNFAVMFSAITAFSLDSYANIALSMGARRSSCFWAVELCGAVSVAVMVGLAAVLRWAVAALPSEDNWKWIGLNKKIWLLLVLAGLFFIQLGMLAQRVERPRWRTAAILLVTFVCCSFSIAIMVTCMLEDLALTDWLLTGMLAGFPVGTVAAGFAASRKYRKAVVRV